MKFSLAAVAALLSTAAIAAPAFDIEERADAVSSKSLPPIYHSPITN